MTSNNLTFNKKNLYRNVFFYFIEICVLNFIFFKKIKKPFTIVCLLYLQMLINIYNNE